MTGTLFADPDLLIQVEILPHRCVTVMGDIEAAYHHCAVDVM